VPTNQGSLYTSRIIKGGALLPETRAFLKVWDEEAGLKENIDRVRRDNLLGKSSRSRVDDVLAVLRQRYLGDPAIVKALTYMVKCGVPNDICDRIFYLYTADSDRLLHDIVVQVIYPNFREFLMSDISALVEHALGQWVSGKMTVSPWSENTIVRVRQGLLDALRDFSVLTGAVKKKLNKLHLPVQAFAYIAFALNARKMLPAVGTLENPEWHLFFLSIEEVEKLFLAAHQEGLLHYQAAGSVIRLEFPTTNIEEYAHVIVERSH
jgi:hypothetical protein